MTESLKIVAKVSLSSDLLRASIDNIIGERRETAKEWVRKTLVYQAEMGATRVLLEELPGVTSADSLFIVDWLQGEGFDVVRPRFGGRSYVVLQE